MKASRTVFWFWFSLMTRTPSILQGTFSHLSAHQTIYLLLSTTVLPKLIYLNTTRTHLYKKCIKWNFSQKQNNNMACCINTSLDSFQTTRLLLNYATSLTSGKWPLRKESKFIRFSWILVKPMISFSFHFIYLYRIVEKNIVLIKLRSC